MEPIKIIGIIVLMLGVVGFKYFLRNKKNENDDDIEKNIIKQPKGYIKIAISLMAMMILTIIIIWSIGGKSLFSTTEDMIGVHIVFFIFIIAGFILLMYSINWKIELFDTYFIHTNMLGKKRKYEYTSIRLVDCDAGYRIYKGKRRIIDISYLQTNYEQFPIYYKKHGKIEYWKKKKAK